MCAREEKWMQEGFKPGMDPVMFDDIWLHWAFEVNVVYNLVH